MVAPAERVRFEGRQHGVVLAGAIARGVALTAAGVALFAVGWPATLAGAVALAVAAASTLRAVWRWDRTQLVVTTERLTVVTGTIRRSRADVPLAKVSAIEVEQSVFGRVLGYGTLIAGDLEVPYVPDPGAVADLTAH